MRNTWDRNLQDVQTEEEEEDFQVSGMSRFMAWMPSGWCAHQLREERKEEEQI